MPITDLPLISKMVSGTMEPAANVQGALGKLYEDQLQLLQQESAARRLQEMRGQQGLEEQRLRNRGQLDATTAQIQAYADRMTLNDQVKTANDLTTEFGARPWDPKKEDFSVWYQSVYPEVRENKIKTVESAYEQLNKEIVEARNLEEKSIKDYDDTAKKQAWQMLMIAAKDKPKWKTLLTSTPDYDKLIAADRKKWPPELGAAILDAQAAYEGQLLQLKEKGFSAASSAGRELENRRLRIAQLQSGINRLTTDQRYGPDVWARVNKTIGLPEKQQAVAAKGLLPEPAPGPATGTQSPTSIYDAWAKTGYRDMFPAAAATQAQDIVSGPGGIPASAATALAPAFPSLGRGLVEGIKSLPGMFLSPPQQGPAAWVPMISNLAAGMGVEKGRGGSPFAFFAGNVIPPALASVAAGKIMPPAIRGAQGYTPNYVRIPPRNPTVSAAPAFAYGTALGDAMPSYSAAQVPLNMQLVPTPRKAPFIPLDVLPRQQPVIPPALPPSPTIPQLRAGAIYSHDIPTTYPAHQLPLAVSYEMPLRTPSPYPSWLYRTSGD